MLTIAWQIPIFMTLFLLKSLGYILIFEWPKLVKNNVALWLITPFYIIIPFLIFLKLNFLDEHHRDLLFMFMLVIASFDSGSYIVGKLCGKHKLCPLISPNKTIEGAVGGLFLAHIAWYGLYYHFLLHYSLPGSHFIWLPAICFLALCGDLFESWLKRKAFLKDAGYVLPGHGGLLDRFDSYLWASYFLFAIINRI
jgi:phosphatidate cytidylyltransferase